MKLLKEDKDYFSEISEKVLQRYNQKYEFNKVKKMVNELYAEFK